MRRINRSFYIYETLTLLVLLLSFSAFGSEAGYAQNLWSSYTSGEKQLAIAGFADCVRTQSSSKSAFANTDLVSVVRFVDDTAKSSDLPFANLILEALQKAPVAKPDPHAEHWSGPTGFHSGLWWRGVEDGERLAYVQGIVWCTQASGISARVADTSSQATVAKLNNWYVITDDDWKDPRSNARVDVPVISALQKIEVLHIKGAKPK